MFGYISPNTSALNDEQNKRFRAVYCGLCHTLRERHGLIGCATLSYDLTFLALLLTALYEPSEIVGQERCVPHPFKTHTYVVSEPFGYAADMNLALAYHKCQDNWQDDRSIPSLAQKQALKRGYAKVQTLYPKQCAAIETWLHEIHRIEFENRMDIDAPVNATGRMLGELFSWRSDCWSDSLREIGDGLGRFIYFMDAYDDLPQDAKRGRFNPLKPYQGDAAFESMCRDAMVMMMGDCTQAFEQLPILQDADLLRNVLYSGVWGKYVQIQKKRRTNEKGAE